MEEYSVKTRQRAQELHDNYGAVSLSFYSGLFLVLRSKLPQKILDIVYLFISTKNIKTIWPNLGAPFKFYSPKNCQIPLVGLSSISVASVHSRCLDVSSVLMLKSGAAG